jgi:hypothetical protein
MAYRSQIRPQQLLYPLYTSCIPLIYPLYTSCI